MGFYWGYHSKLTSLPEFWVSFVNAFFLLCLFVISLFSLFTVSTIGNRQNRKHYINQPSTKWKYHLERQLTSSQTPPCFLSSLSLFWPLHGGGGPQLGEVKPPTQRRSSGFVTRFFLHEGRSAWQSPKNVGGYNSSGGPALVNIRQKDLSSSVGFRKHMMSRSPRSLICDPIHLHFDHLYPTCLIFGERFCPTFSIIPRLIPINSNKKMPLPPFKGCFDVSSLFLLRGEKDLSVDVYTE